MKPKLKVILPVLVALGLCAAAFVYASHYSVPVLQPRGPIGEKERGVLGVALLLGMIVILPVFALTIAIAYRYREGNPKRVTYAPNWSTNKFAETIWWAFPIAIIGVLSVITWQSSYALDPFKQVPSAKNSLHVQVVALDWKWLFLYPDQGVASVNLVAIPTDTTVDFEITSDTVMNSFWVPQLGGQMYAMPGMKTHLNTLATQTGSYAGAAANISGSGFAGMKFTVAATTQKDFDAWVKTAKSSSKTLDAAAFASLQKPSKSNPTNLYKSYQPGLYDRIVMKYMIPTQTQTKTQTNMPTHMVGAN